VLVWRNHRRLAKKRAMAIQHESAQNFVY